MCFCCYVYCILQEYEFDIIFISLNHNLSPSYHPKIRIETRPFSDGNLDKLVSDLLETDWLQITGNLNLLIDIHQSCQLFISHLDALYCKNFPIKIKFISEKRMENRWVTPELKKLMFDKSVVFKKWKMGLISREENNAFRNKVNIEVRGAKNNFNKNSFSAARSDMRKNWKLIHDLMGSKNNKCITDKIVVDGREFSDPQDISNHFNNYFSSVASNLANQLPAPTTENPVFFWPVL